MQPSDDHSPPSVAPEERLRPGLLGIVVRIVLPIVLLVVGIIGYGKLSIKQPEEAPPRPEAKAIEARVHELKRQDYHARSLPGTHPGP